jgi:hypothetical protein
MTKLQILKNELKQLATDLRHFKNVRNTSFRSHSILRVPSYLSDAQMAQYNIWKRKYEYRHKHIAYCQLRGRRREQIERPASWNLPNEDYILELMEKYQKVMYA